MANMLSGNRRFALAMVGAFGASAGLLLLSQTVARSISASPPPPPGVERFVEVARVSSSSAQGVPGWGGPLTASSDIGARSPRPSISAAERARFSLPLAGWSAISDPFGVPRGENHVHGGIDLDLAGFSQSFVYAACDGLVTRAGYDATYGNHVVVDCGDGWSTVSAHFSELSVSEGSFVAGGRSVIGISGSTGYSTGEHLHFEVRYLGVPIDPELVLDFSP